MLVAGGRRSRYYNAEKAFKYQKRGLDYGQKNQISQTVHTGDLWSYHGLSLASVILSTEHN